MITRRLVCAPSAQRFLRCMASMAQVQSSAHQAPSSPQPATSSSLITPVRRQAPAASSRAPRIPSSIQTNQGSSPHVNNLLVHIAQAPADIDDNHHEEAWRLYGLLTRQERASLSAKELALILRSVVPRYQSYWNVFHRTPKRARHLVLTLQVASQWEARLRTVMADLVATGRVHAVDWWFVLQTLSNIGLVTACEAICREMPDKLRYHPNTSEFRLGAVVRWSRNLIDDRRPPSAPNVELAYDTFWNIFRHMKDTQFNAFTLRLLLSTTAEVATLLQLTRNDEELNRMRNLVDFVVLKAYGIDLNNIALSLHEQQKVEDLVFLSAKALNAILRHLVIRDIEPYSLVSAFELLSARQHSLSTKRGSSLDEEEEEDFGPPPSASSTEGETEHDGHNWLGFKVANDTGSLASGTASSLEPLPYSSRPEVSQCHRSRLDFLPSIQPLRASLSTTNGPEMPSKATYNDDSIVILLNHMRRHKNTRLFHHVLETALHDAKSSQAAWLSSYLSCPPAKRSQLFQPQRISPEWFRIALAYSRERSYRWASRFAFSIREGGAWTTELANIIIETETGRGAVPRAVQDGRPIFSTPDFAAHPRLFRVYRNAGKFIVSEHLKLLYHDIDRFELLLLRAMECSVKRVREEL